MKCLVMIFLSGTAFFSCSYNSIEKINLPTEIKILGKSIDTVYLYTVYNEEGAMISEDHDHDGMINSCDCLPVSQIDGEVDTHLPGEYLISYSGVDSKGNYLKPQVRKVIVIENSSTFLNGNYNVTCTCIAKSTEANNLSTAVTHYTASVSSSKEKNGFELSAFEIGNESVTPHGLLIENKIFLDYYSPNFQLTNGDGGKGYLSLTGDSFYVESIAYAYHPVQTFWCKNLFVRKTIISK